MGPRSPRPSAALGAFALLLAACSLSVLETVATRPRHNPAPADGGAQLDAPSADAPGPDAGFADVTTPDASDAPLADVSADALDAAPDAPLADVIADVIADVNTDAPDAFDGPPPFDAPVDAPPAVDAADVISIDDVPLSDVVVDDVRLPDRRCDGNADCPEGLCVRFDCSGRGPGLCVPSRLCRALSSSVCGCDERTPVDLCTPMPLGLAFPVAPRACGVAADAGPPDVPAPDAPACDTDNDPRNCGACGTVCAAPTNATPRCQLGTCQSVCNAGFGDCDGNAANGCETVTFTDALNCGACRRSCGANEACMAGTCVLLNTSRCEPPLVRCDLGMSRVCVDLQSSNAHCGSCGHGCTPAEICSGGACVCRPRYTCSGLDGTTTPCTPPGVPCRVSGLYCTDEAECIRRGAASPITPSCWTCTELP